MSTKTTDPPPSRPMVLLVISFTLLLCLIAACAGALWLLDFGKGPNAVQLAVFGVLLLSVLFAELLILEWLFPRSKKARAERCEPRQVRKGEMKEKENQKQKRRKAAGLLTGRFEEAGGGVAVVREPVIISAPMFGTANGRLAGSVSKAGGIGFIGGGFLFSSGSDQLAALASELSTAREVLSAPEGSDIPVGAGFILCHESVSLFVENVIPVLKENRPVAVWLFAPRPVDVDSGLVKEIVQELKREGFMVWFQIGTVASARRALEDGVDVVVCQGADAGGHGFEGGAGVVSLVVEVRRMLEGDDKGKKVMVVAAGGFVEGNGVVAGLALGAQGVVMGTRFLLAEEAGTPEFRQQLLIESRDGGPATFKSSAMDDIQGTGIWPMVYDGRALRTESVRDYIGGLPMKRNVEIFNKAKTTGDTSRLITWAGTGVGLLSKIQPAGEIVQEVRAEAISGLKKLRSSYN